MPRRSLAAGRGDSMALGPEERARLAAAQAELVAALVAQGPPPPGFDAERLRVAAGALAQKRQRELAQAWPRLVQGLGASWPSSFATFAAAVPLPREGGPLADGRAFAAWLEKKESLPEGGRLEALATDLRYRRCADGLLPRRGPAVRVAWLGRSKKLVLALRWPGLGERWLRLF